MLLPVIAACVAAAPADEVRGTMRGNLAALVALQPLLQRSEGFADPKNAATIRSALAALARTRHKFPRPASQEPAAALATLFSEVISHAQTDFSGGRFESARLRLRGATTLCLGCHSRQLAHDDFTAAGKAGDGAGLPPLERAGFLAATRQFDGALALWGDALRTPPETDAEAFAHSQALRAALSVAIRAKDDPLATRELLQLQCARQPLAATLRRACRQQLDDAKAWSEEKLTAAQAAAQRLFERAGELIDASNALETVFPREEERVKLLRATAYLSLALEREPKAQWRGEALYRLGVATGATLDPDLWALDGLYLEACIRENPHSALAVKCVDRLGERTVFDYTGSGGTRLPPDVAQRLDALRALAR